MSPNIDSLNSEPAYSVVRQTWLSRPPAKRAGILIGWLILLLILSSVVYWTNFKEWQSLMPASGQAVFEKKEYWRLWTALFAHGDVKHLLSNCLTFFVVGYFLIGYFSLWFFPFAGFFFGGVVNYLTLKTYPPAVSLIGVSGVVYWMAGAWLVLYFLLDLRKTKTQRAVRALGVAIGIFMPASAFDPSISYIAHLLGFVFGVLCGGIYYWMNRSQFKRALRVEHIFESPLDSTNNSDSDIMKT